MLIDFIRGYFLRLFSTAFRVALTLCMSAFTSAIAVCRRIGRKYPDDFQALKRADIKLRREIRFADYRRPMHYKL